MRKFMLSCAACLSISSTVSAEWQDHWIAAVKYYELKQYESSEFEINTAISKVWNDQRYQYVYIDRAKIYLEQKKYQECSSDALRALACKDLKSADRIEALCVMIKIGVEIEDIDMCMQYTDELKKIYPYFPEITMTKKNVIIRNFDRSGCGSTLMRAYLICSELCEREEDITETESGVMIGRRKIKINPDGLETCGCGCGGGCEPEMPELAPNDQKVTQCKNWCNRGYFTTATWCSSRFSGRCYAVCALAAESFREMCEWCCDEGRDKCTAYYNAINNYMAKAGCQVD